MATKQKDLPSRFIAFLTIFVFLGVMLGIGWWAYTMTVVRNQDLETQPTPTPTPESGVFNIDEQLDMLN